MRFVDMCSIFNLVNSVEVGRKIRSLIRVVIGSIQHNKRHILNI